MSRRAELSGRITRACLNNGMSIQDAAETAAVVLPVLEGWAARPFRVAGRLAWDEKGNYHTPWFAFQNMTEFRTWCRDMRAAQGKPGQALKSEHIWINGQWTPESLLAKTRADEKHDPIIEPELDEREELILAAVRSLADIFATGSHAEQVLQRIRDVLDEAQP